jgi:hypothetical protein
MTALTMGMELFVMNNGSTALKESWPSMASKAMLSGEDREKIKHSCKRQTSDLIGIEDFDLGKSPETIDLHNAKQACVTRNEKCHFKK